MLRIHHVPATRGFRVIWLCEELDVPYEIVPVDFSRTYRASAEWRAMNPVGKVPVMTAGDLTMFESGAMVQHVLDRHGGGRLEPERGTREHALYLQWSWFAEATFTRPLGEIVNHRREFGDRAIPEVVEEMEARARLCLDAVDEAVRGTDYLVDDFTAADIMMGYALRSYRRLLPDDPLPADADAYWNRLAGRDAYRAAIAAESP
ncbi:MAG: glutathione S-transferase [Gammaproteobacteria bacterium]|nr:glutathione S-transferase [Gammaproteobacteria bacterium]